VSDFQDGQNGPLLGLRQCRAAQNRLEHLQLYGGGIGNDNPGATTLTVSNCTISQNKAAGLGTVPRGAGACFCTQQRDRVTRNLHDHFQPTAERPVFI
jgi:hypothetical protein